MSKRNDKARHHPTTHRIDDKATTHDLLNGATEWLQYSRGMTELLSDLIYESENVDCEKMALALDGIAAMTQLALECAADAHVRVTLAYHTAAAA